MSSTDKSANKWKKEKFEVVLDKLQGIVRDLESGDCSLEDSLKKFEEGVNMAKACQERLNDAEKKIEVLINADEDGVKTAPFDDEE